MLEMKKFQSRSSFRDIFIVSEISFSAFIISLQHIGSGPLMVCLNAQLIYENGFLCHVTYDGRQKAENEHTGNN